ncbi:MAG: TIGR04282 family arsenosugar biosynthesis glycosyltransferase [Magnetococcales bacterium]|nr:TIGR04282 family arsenosugar biosynthesis glycosyltransferase [Magnetococcales bacterium]
MIRADALPGAVADPGAALSTLLPDPLRKARLSLNLLGRAPEPGCSKTRLIPTLGPLGAAQAHAALLTHVARVARNWCAVPESGRLFRLWGTPDFASPLLADLANESQRRIQPEGDLGERLDWIARAGLAEAEMALLLGGDAPSVDSATLDLAEHRLSSHAALLVPARDGGYVLLGLRDHARQLFADIPWGSDRVAERTREILRELAWSWEEIPGHWDVDRIEDWERFIALHKLVR